MSDSTIRIGINGSAAYIGPDAVSLFRATLIKHAIDLYVTTGVKVNRAYTPSAMLATASAITGKPYKRGKAGLRLAAFDLSVWCAAMAAALPVEG